MARLGSDPDQMTELALVLEREANQMRSSASGINSMMRDVRWWGPAHDFFLGWWDSKQHKWLIELADTLDSLGQTVSDQATEQFQASNSMATLRLNGGNSIMSGKAGGFVFKLRPEFQSTLWTYADSNRGDVSVYVADRVAIDYDDIAFLEMVVVAVFTGSIGGAFLEAMLPGIGGSIGAGFATERRWYNNKDAVNIQGHFISQTGTFANALDRVGNDDVLTSIENNDVPPPDSTTDWFVLDAEVGVSVGFSLTPNFGADLEGGAKFGTEKFSNGDTAYITQYGVGVSAEAGLGLAGVPFVGNVPAQLAFKTLAGYLDIDVAQGAFDLDKIGGGFEWDGEYKLLVDSNGDPKSLVVSNSLTAFKSHATGTLVSNSDITNRTVFTKFEFDLTDPEVLSAVKGSPITAVNDLIFGEDSVARSAQGVRYVTTGETDQVNVGFVVWDAEQAGSQYTVESAKFKEAGSSEFIDM